MTEFRNFFWVTLLAVFGFSCTSETPSEEPNFIIFYTDDQSYNTIHAWGNEEISTPAMDWIAENGVSFVNTHNMGGHNGALCIVSRAMLLTGRTVNNLHQKGSVIPPEHSTLPELLSAHGWKTFMTGKWHNDRMSLGRMWNQGNAIYLGGMHWPSDGGHEHPLLRPYDSTGAFPKERMYQSEEYSSVAYSNAAINFIETTEDPFLVYMAYTAPHDPRTPPAEFNYDTANITLPPNYMPAHPFNNGEMKVRDENLLPTPRTKTAIKQEIANYYGMISEVDHEMGRVIETLRNTGKLENTYIIFVGDNGLAVGSHGLLGKQNLYDHSIRVPLMIAGPNLPKNIKNKEFASIPDVTPTILELAGIQQPEGSDGLSLVSSIEDGKELRENAYFIYRNLQRGVRTKDGWKLIKYLVNGEVITQLFHMNEDPYELNNLADSTHYSAQRNRLEEILAQEMKRYNDELDASLPYFGKTVPRKRVLENGNPFKNAEVSYVSGTYPAKYAGENSDRSLIDGSFGFPGDLSIGWQGFEGENLEIILELKEKMRIDTVFVSLLENQGAWIFFPRSVEVYFSEDGKQYLQTASKGKNLESRAGDATIEEWALPLQTETKYVKIIGRNVDTLPNWHAGAGNPGWLFIDEIWIKPTR